MLNRKISIGNNLFKSKQEVNWTISLAIKLSVIDALCVIFIINLRTAMLNEFLLINEEDNIETGYQKHFSSMLIFDILCMSNLVAWYNKYIILQFHQNIDDTKTKTWRYSFFLFAAWQILALQMHNFVCPWNISHLKDNNTMHTFSFR